MIADWLESKHPEIEHLLPLVLLDPKGQVLSWQQANCDDCVHIRKDARWGYGLATSSTARTGYYRFPNLVPGAPPPTSGHAATLLPVDADLPLPHRGAEYELLPDSIHQVMGIAQAYARCIREVSPQRGLLSETFRLQVPPQTIELLTADFADFACLSAVDGSGLALFRLSYEGKPLQVVMDAREQKLQATGSSDSSQILTAHGERVYLLSHNSPSPWRERFGLDDASRWQLLSSNWRDL